MTGRMAAASLLPSLSFGSRILIVRLRSVGDIVLLTPALQLLKEWRPDLLLSVLVESRFQALLEGNPDVAEVLLLDDSAGIEKIVSRARTIRRLQQRKFALCVNLHGGPTSAFLTRFSAAPAKAGFAHFRSQASYDFPIPDARAILNQETIHTAEHQASAFFWLGLPRRQVPRARLFTGPEAEDWWRQKRLELDLPEDRSYALVHPTALYATKQWAPEHFARLGAYLEREHDLVPVFSCSPSESATLDAVEAAAGSPIRRLQDAPLGKFIAAVAEARLFVGNDSGPAHISTALGRPSVVIFGSSSSAIWGPWPRNGTGRIVQNFYECNPCPGDRCYRFDRPECILSVRTEQVQAAIEGLLKSSQHGQSEPTKENPPPSEDKR
jgi:heptosyltransferase III